MASPTKYGSIKINNNVIGSPLDEVEESSTSNRINSLTTKRSVIIGLCLIASALVYIGYKSKEEYVSMNHVETVAYRAKVREYAVPKDLESTDFPEMYYNEQYIDHKYPDRGYYSQRYYEVKDYFGGPGSPIFLIMAGEDDLDEILYPFIWKTLGQQYKAYSINIEHRYYGAKGESWPLSNPSNADLLETLSTRAGLDDAVRLVQYKQKELGCGPKGTPTYCPVLSVGGSYPGFLAGLLRILYPDVIDIGYASSSPFKIYSHEASTHVYFDKITLSAEHASPGCAAAVKTALVETQNDILASTVDDIPTLATKYGLCIDTLPDYMKTSTQMLTEELMESIASHFAEHNMGYYPPKIYKALFVSCQLFQNDNMTTSEKVSQFLLIDGEDDARTDCYDITIDLPPYPNATVSASDWSGVGGGPSGVFWDFQCCLLMPECGLSSKSMFPHREWTLEWQTDHCQPRFNITPEPKALVNEYQFGDLSNVTRLLLVNGLVDGWSAASYTEPESNWKEGNIKIVNILNGAHHSELRQVVPNLDRDTPDLIGAYWEITKIVGEWLHEVKEEQK